MDFESKSTASAQNESHSKREASFRTMKWRLLLLAAFAMGGLSAFIAIPAGATDGCPASGAPFNVFYQNGTGGRGVRVANPGMTVYDTEVGCGRVSSLFVMSGDAANFAEVGWYESPANAYSCLDNSTGFPKQLAFVRYSGLRDCLHSPATVFLGTYEFAIRDDDQNGIWAFFHSGSQIWSSPDTGSFNSGIQQNNGERLNTHNTSRAMFEGLQKRDSNKSWVSWSGVGAPGDDDSGHKGCFYSNTHQAVKQNSETC